jgi:shikimate dehydrogenase
MNPLAPLIEAREGAVDADDSVVVGLIGSGISGSLSPALHEREASLLGLDYSYLLFDLEELELDPSDAGSLVRAAQEAGLRGLNVTHPCKQLAVDELDGMSPEASALGAVNTIVFDDDAVGYNTDYTGFRDAFARGLPDAAIERVVLLGAGGAGAAVGHAILSLGAGRLTVIDVERERAEALAGALRRSFGPGVAEAADAGSVTDHLELADGLIHATPTGMAAHPGSAVPADALHPRLWVAEVVYMPLETELLANARERGCRTLDGVAMVALQAAGSFELFTGERADRERMLRHVADLAGR